MQNKEVIQHLKISGAEFLNFALPCLIFEFIRLVPDKTSFLVTILAGKRLFPFRTQKLSPSGRW